MLCLFSIRRFHQNATVLIVDNHLSDDKGVKVLTNTTSPISNPGFASWYHGHVRVLTAPKPDLKTGLPPKELGAYALALQHIRLLQKLSTYDTFVFMQFSILLAEPLPLIVSPRVTHCHVRPFLNYPQAPLGQITSALWLRGTGMDGLPGIQLGKIGGSAAAHCSFAADFEGVKAMFAPQNHLLTPGSVPTIFDSPLYTNWTTEFEPGLLKDLSMARQWVKQIGWSNDREPLTGVLVNSAAVRAAQNAAIPLGNKAACGKRALEWRGFANGYRDPASPHTPVGYHKLHSQRSWVEPANVILTMLLRLADDNLDGMISERELAQGIAEKQSTFEPLWQAACLVFPAPGHSPWPSCNDHATTYWGITARNMLVTLSSLRLNDERAFSKVLSPIAAMLAKQPKTEHIWGPIEPALYATPSDAHEQNASSTMQNGVAFRQFAHSLAAAFFNTSYSYPRLLGNLMGFDALFRVIHHPAFGSDVLLPHCVTHAAAWASIPKELLAYTVKATDTFQVPTAACVNRRPLHLCKDKLRAGLCNTSSAFGCKKTCLQCIEAAQTEIQKSTRDPKGDTSAQAIRMSLRSFNFDDFEQSLTQIKSKSLSKTDQLRWRTLYYVKNARFCLTPSWPASEMQMQTKSLAKLFAVPDTPCSSSTVSLGHSSTSLHSVPRVNGTCGKIDPGKAVAGFETAGKSKMHLPQSGTQKITLTGKGRHCAINCRSACLAWKPPNCSLVCGSQCRRNCCEWWALS